MINELELTGVTFKRNLGTRFWKLVGQYKASIARVSLADCFALALTTTLRGTLLNIQIHHEFDRIVPLKICPITLLFVNTLIPNPCMIVGYCRGNS
jgi:Na+-transporting NADH:ubiquinone oxidoreductase subunit NqrA